MTLSKILATKLNWYSIKPLAKLGESTVTIVQIANRCYGLTHEIPDKVLRYIGGGQENLGEAHSQQETSRMVVAGISKGAGAVNEKLNPKDKDSKSETKDKPKVAMVIVVKPLKKNKGRPLYS